MTLDSPRRFPPLPPEKLARAAPYVPAGGEPGYEGHPPEKMPARDFPEVEENGVRKPPEGRVNVNIDRIEWLYAHDLIEARQCEAARLLSKDWELAQIEPRASTVLVGAGGGEARLPTDVKVDAMKRHGAARKALGRGWPIIELIVQDRLSVEAASARLRLHAKVGMGYLQLALHMLADHYRLPGGIPDDVIAAAAGGLGRRRRR
ncbi:MAG TPA: DUF6456 domain-containing protein [Rhizomicrobium sp.]|nr:DUF6456 domain-containing protein [Rhizomicrobium sp.]